jgi:subtilisin family serine protease
MAKSIKVDKKKTENATPPLETNLFQVLGDRPRFTGKRIVTMNPQAAPSAMRTLTKKASLRVASIRDFSTGSTDFQQAFNEGDGIYFDSFKIAILNDGNEEQVSFMNDRSAGTNSSFESEPERFIYALPGSPVFTRATTAATAITDNSNATWGVQAVKALLSSFTGKGINVAVLDTGLNLAHPDFARLTIQSKSFIKNALVEDKNGHGTHCCGVSVGAIDKKTNQRYGVASGANLFVGKVLSDKGSGSDSGILAGIEWALLNKCRVISMSLGAAVKPGETFSPAYERVAKTALKNNCLIVAAAGNESQREFGLINPVGHPANCPSVLAVAAIDSVFKVADFSCGGINVTGGQVDIAAPGVNIFSSWKGRKHKTISGTSMATPFVAGLAALLCEANPGAPAASIWMMLGQNALRLNLNASDIGSGLAQAK